MEGHHNPSTLQARKMPVIQPTNYIKKPQRGVKPATVPWKAKRAIQFTSPGETQPTSTHQNVLTEITPPKQLGKHQQQHIATVRPATGVVRTTNPSSAILPNMQQQQIQRVQSVKRPSVAVSTRPSITVKKKARTEKWEQYADGVVPEEQQEEEEQKQKLKQKKKSSKYSTHRKGETRPPLAAAAAAETEEEEEVEEEEEEEELYILQDTETDATETEEEAEEEEKEQETEQETEEEEEGQEEEAVLQEQGEEEEQPMCVDQMDGGNTVPTSAILSQNKGKNEKRYPTLMKQLRNKAIVGNIGSLTTQQQQALSSTRQKNGGKNIAETSVPSVTKQTMLTPYIPPTFPVVMFHLGRGRYLSGGYVDGVHVLRIQDNYPKKYEDERRRYVKLNISQFLDLVACFGSVSGEVNRLKTAKQSSINEDDRKHIGRNVYVSIFRSTDENLFVDIRQFYVPEDDFAKGNCRLVPTKVGISLREAEWEQLTKVAQHMKTFIPALKNATRCSSTHQYQEHIQMCPHCTPNWMC